MKITVEIRDPFFIVGLLKGFSDKVLDQFNSVTLAQEINSLANQIEEEALKQ